MKSITKVVALGLAAAAAACLAPPARAQSPVGVHNAKIVVGYVEPSSERFKPMARRLKERKFLEELAEFLSPLQLPHPLKLIAEECNDKDMSNYYRDSVIHFCYAYLQTIEDAAPTPERPDRLGMTTRAEAIVGMFVGAALHETGHALFDLLNVPVFGREEDAADQIAIFIALQMDKEVARTIVKGRARFYGALGSDPGEFKEFQDAHGTSSQRFYNFLCLAYGGDPDNFQEFVDRGLLPQSRAGHCAAEYQKVRRAFVKTVLPFIDAELMKKVQARKWLRAEEMR